MRKSDWILLIAMALLALIMLVVGCKDAEIQQIKSIGSRHRVTLYGATGTVIKQWEATGNVSNEQNSDGWYFKDAQTGKLVEVTGTLVIEQE
jgi:hypothetical protein